jgi:hypothetical protein
LIVPSDWTTGRQITIATNNNQKRRLPQLELIELCSN